MQIETSSDKIKQKGRITQNLGMGKKRENDKAD